MKSANSWWVYMIETQSGKLYTGITTDVERRFQEHCGSPKGAKFFRTDPAKQVVYREVCLTRSAATQRESVIKKLPKIAKWALLANPS